MKKFLQALKGKVPALAGVASTAAVAGAASASGGGGVDVGDVVAAIQGAAGPIALIGGAVLTIMVGIKVYKWVRRAM